MPRHDSNYRLICHRLSCLFPHLADCFTHFALHCAARSALPREVAMERMCLVHRAANDAPFELGLISHASFYIQCHAAAAASSLSVHDLYLQRLNPASRESSVVVCYPLRRNDSAVVKAWHSEQHDNRDVLAKLVRKGGPAPSSVRYVAGLMRRCAQQTTEGARAVKDMLCSHFLGGYRHSSQCADPLQHIKFASMTASQLLDYAMTAATTRQLHGIVSEYVCANTLVHSALVASVGDVAARHAHGVAAGTLRAFGRTTPPHRTTTHSCFMTLAKALNVNNNSTRAPDLTPAEVAAASASIGILSPHTAMSTLGIANADELEALAICSDKARNNTLKSMRMILKKLRPRPRQFLSLSIYHTLRVNRLLVQDLSYQVQQAQLAALARHHRQCARELTYCQNCGTFRCAVLGAKMPRTRSGVAVDIESDVVHCNNCESSDSLVHIDLAGRAVTLLGKHLDTATAIGPVTLCCRCSQATVYTAPCGNYPLCASCHKQSQWEIYRPQSCCVCGISNSGSAVWVDVIANGGGVDMAWFCKTHAHLAPDHTVTQDDLDACLRLT